jgi:putative membrane protein
MVMNRRRALQILPALVAGTALLSNIQPVRAESVDYESWRLGMLVGGSFTLQLSQAALKVSQNQRVRQFAAFEVAEQTAVAQVLMDTSDPNPPAPPLDQQHTAAVNSVRSRSGADFDVTYIQAQIVGHRELLQLTQNYLGAPLTDPVQRRSAILLRPVLMEHLALLASMQS